MGGAIKIYKKQVRIMFFDKTEDLIVNQEIDKLNQVLNSGVKFIKVGGEIINVGDIRRIKPEKTKEEIIDERRSKREE